jgi:aspartate/methionine/tyrosine aminotransferase
MADHARVGVFRPVQEAGVAALTGPQDTVEERRVLYEARRERVLAVAPDARCDGSFFAWWRLPDGLTAERLLTEHRVAVAPGEGFGPAGAGWVRISLATLDEALDLGLARLRSALGL